MRERKAKGEEWREELTGRHGGGARRVETRFTWGDWGGRGAAQGGKKVAQQNSKRLGSQWITRLERAKAGEPTRFGSRDDSDTKIIKLPNNDIYYDILGTCSQMI